MIATTTLIPAAERAAARAEELVAQLDLPADGIRVHDPATGRVVAHVPDQPVESALAAADAADRAGRDWAALPPRRRADVLLEWWRLLTDRTDDIAHVMTLEAGKPLAEARAEVKYGADYVRWFAEEAVRSAGGFRDAPEGGARYLFRRSPVGLSVLITPWNFPLAMATRKIAPALAAGCAAVVKPASSTPLTTWFAVRLAIEAGVPEDLVRVVTTSDSSGFSEAVLAHPAVRKVSFTGSTGVGKRLLEIAGRNVLRTSMELGGNAAFIVCDDADLERAVDGAVAAKLRNGGQSCIAANRYYVQSGIADEFVAAFAERLRDVRLGHGLGDGTQVGPLISRKAVDSMSALVDDAVSRGAELRCGGVAVEGEGNFFAPALLDGVPADADVATTEIFGPIAAVQRFDGDEEVIAKANGTDFGLAGYVFSESIDRALDLADRLETGVVGINQGVPSNAHAAFGGVKHSGMGREGGDVGIDEYQHVRFFNIARRG